MTRSKIYSLLILIALGFGFLTPIHGTFAAGASLYLSPGATTQEIGSTFRVSVMVNSGGDDINAAEGAISYDTNLLDAVSVAKGNIFMFWTTEPSIGGGSVRFGGGSPSPYNGSAGHVVTVTFKAKQAGTATIRFTSGAVLANDGKGTNVLASMGSGTYTISPKSEAPPAPSGSSGSSGGSNDRQPEQSKPSYEPAYNKPKIVSETHPDQNTWYLNDDVKFAWDLPSGVNGVSIGFDQEPVADPGPLSDGLFEEKLYENVEGGIWYLHLKFKDATKWGTLEHYRVMIDMNPPSPFKIKVNNFEVGEWPTLEFETSDEESGLERYEVYVGSLDQQAHKLEADKKRIQLKDLAPGTHTVLVKAVDKAGNERIETVEFVIDPIPTPKIEDYPAEIRPGDKFYMSGTGLENSTVTTYIEDGGRIIASSTVEVDANGNWLSLESVELEKGRYTAYVIGQNKEGIKSGESSRISFVVSPPVFAELGSMIIDYFTVIVSLLFMIVLIILIVFLIFFLARRKLRKETFEAEDVLKKNFSLLRKDLATEYEEIIAKEKTAAGKKREAESKERLDKKLAEAEKKIMKEIKDVEELVD